jgi:hypothetical protein
MIVIVSVVNIEVIKMVDERRHLYRYVI